MRSVVAVLSLTQLISWGVLFFSFAVIVVPMRRELHTGLAATTGAFTAGLVAYALASPLIGRYLDRGSAKRLMTVGAMAAALFLAAWSRVDGLVALYAVWAGIGATMATLLYDPAFVVVMQVAPEHARAGAVATITVVGGLARVAFLPLTALLVHLLEWRGALLVLAAFLLFVVAPLHGVYLPGRDHPARRVRAAPGAAAAAMRSSAFYALAIAVFAGFAAVIGLSVHLVALFVDHGASLSAAAAAAAIVGVAQLPGRLLYLPLERHLSPAVLYGLSFGLPALGIAGLLADVDGPLGLAGLAVVGFGSGAAMLVRAMAPQQLFGTASYGAISGALAGIWALAAASGPLIFAAVADLSSTRTALAATAGLALLAGVAASGASLLHVRSRAAA